MTHPNQHAALSFPRISKRNSKTWYGQVTDLYVRLEPGKKEYLGRFNSQEEAEAAYAKFVETGERPPKRKRVDKRQERTARIHIIRQKRGICYVVKGKLHGKEVHIGCSASEEEANQIAETFLKTGERRSKTYRPKGSPPKPRTYKLRPGRYDPAKHAAQKAAQRLKNKQKVKEVKILPGRNLRDHEIAFLEQNRPELVKPLTERHQQPGETRAEWMRRLAGGNITADVL